MATATQVIAVATGDNDLAMRVMDALYQGGYEVVPRYLYNYQRGKIGLAPLLGPENPSGEEK